MNGSSNQSHMNRRGNTRGPRRYSATPWEIVDIERRRSGGGDGEHIDDSVPTSDNHRHVFRTSSPSSLGGSPIITTGDPHHQRAPSLGELHQELENEQEAQVVRATLAWTSALATYLSLDANDFVVLRTGSCR